MNPLENLNSTIISEITQEQYVKVAMESIGVPFLSVLFVLMSLIFLIVGLVFVKESRTRYLVIWFISVVLTLAFLIFVLILNPNWAFDIVNTVKGWF